MTLTEKEGALYWELMTELQLFVNQKKMVVPDVKSRDAFSGISKEEKLKIREAVYDNPHLIEIFVKKNPHELSMDKLEIISKWVHFKRGNFFIERHLKAHSIFIFEDLVYAVCGILSRIDEVIPPFLLPYHTEAVLLPFKGRIIYDGVLLGHNISFGSGVKGRLRETYLTAKQNNKIIQSLDPESGKPEPSALMKPAKDFRPQIEELIKQARWLKGGTHQPPIHGPVFRLIQATIEMGLAATEDPNDTVRLWHHHKKVVRAINKVHNVLYRGGK